MKSSLVSVIIPTYNRREYICQAIDSVFSQTYKSYEIIVVDDGSTDGTEKLLHQRYGDQIRYIYQHNQGESAARNRAIGESQGQYIALLDSDDIWHPAKLEKQIHFFETHPEVGLVSCHALVIDAAGELKRHIPLHPDLVPEIVPLAKLVLNSPLYCSSVIIRKACLDQVGVFDQAIRYGEDRDLFLRVAAKYQVGFVNEPLVSLRSHQGAQSRLLISAEEMERRVSDRLRIIQRVFPLFDDEQQDLERLKASALAKEYVRAALYDYLCGNPTCGAQRLSEAVTLDVSTWGSGEKLASHIGDYATALAAQGSSAEAIRFVNTLYAHLPEEIRGQLKWFRHSILARVYAESAFMYYQRGDFSIVPSHVLRALLNDFSWFSNLGLLSIAVQAVTGFTPRELTKRILVIATSLIVGVFGVKLLQSKVGKSKT